MAVRIADNLKALNDSTDFPVAYGEDIWLDKNKGVAPANYKSIQAMYNDDELGSGGGSAIQVDSMPAASADELGKIYQYVGDNGTYKKGHLYECVYVPMEMVPVPYKWMEVDHFRFNHVIYNSNTPPNNSDYTVGDIVFYTGKTMDDFTSGHYYRALPTDTPQSKYTFILGSTVYFSYTPFEFRLGFLVYPTGTGGEDHPYEITEISEEGITATPYGWTGEDQLFETVYYRTEILSWEDLGGGGGGSSIFYGTMDEWNALSADEKKQYQFMSDEQVGGGEILPYGVDATLRPKIQFYGVTASTGTGSFKRLKLSDNISILICPNIGTVTGSSSSGEARCTFFFPKTSGKKYNLISFSARQSMTATAYLGYSEFVEESNDWRVDFYMYNCSANNGIYCTATVLEYTA